MLPTDDRVPVLYLAPWVDVGGSDKGTLDWFRFLDRDRYRPSLITTQPNPNRRLVDVVPYADEAWNLLDLMHGEEFARFIVTFIHTRGIKVLHIMNSRLGFELLPDITALPVPPRVVVQLHVEELDRSGYVRYVTTRYGNLVDAFSVSTQVLSDKLDDYEVPRSKRRLIYTGVDARHEFSPERVRPIEDLDSDRFHILAPARLTAQKDPFLMVEVAARLRASGLRFRLHVLGDGELTPAVQERIRALGLEQDVTVRPACVDIAPWYAACDVVLLTSAFEGLPYVLYEAMAMSTPVVAPDLPGLSELVTPNTGVLVSPREEPDSYVAALSMLASDAARREAIGAAARIRVLAEFSLERMAAEHGSLYDELLGAVPQPEVAAQSRSRRGSEEPRGAAALRSRRPRESPLVSVIVPSFNHGHYLRDCLQSIADQTYSLIETIVVDNGSTDPETPEALARLQDDASVTVLRIPTNRGPSAARNAAIERASGRYVLPVDADNLLLPGAVAALVEQLRSAGENVGFIYPNYQFFGNRKEYFEPPSYNLDALLNANYCDTGSLIDREVFDRGFRYSEDVVFGFRRAPYEDWDFVLTLAEHGIYGEPARAKTTLYRKHGFTRSDFVEAGSVPFAEVVAARHPTLFDVRARARLKGTWNPAVSVIALDPLAERAADALEHLVAAARRQTCEDFEVVICTARDVWPTALGGRLRRVPSTLTASRAQAMAQGLEIARGRYVLATYGSAAALLADPTLIEKTLRVLRVNPYIDAIAFAEGDPALASFRLLSSEHVEQAQLGTLCWEALRPSAPPASLELDGQRPLETLARWLSAHATVQWRHLPRRDRRALASRGEGPATAVGAPRHHRARDARLQAEAPPQLPDLPAGIANRIRWPRVWTPPQSRLLCRHVHHATGHYVFSNGRASPPDYTLDRDLGCVRGLPLPGTISLAICGHDNQSSFVLGEHEELDAAGLLGFVEQAPLAMFDWLQIGRHRATGQPVLTAGPEDPLVAGVEDVRSIGYIEPYPIHPRRLPHVDVPYGLIGLVRSIDLDARRHRYGAGDLPNGQLEGELGSLFAEPIGECEPIWIDENGRVSTAGWACLNGRPSVGTAMRWTGAPLTWSGFSSAGPKVRATTRRAYDSVRILASRPSMGMTPPSDPAGYLLRSATSRTIPLYAGSHPVTGDQLLSTLEAEPRSLGYAHCALLGHLVASAPVTGTLGLDRLAVPWASRFGQVVG
ncbi:MAG: glycosyltransferase [Solirubrobacteraceae bacterium]